MAISELEITPQGNEQDTAADGRFFYNKSPLTLVDTELNNDLGDEPLGSLGQEYVLQAHDLFERVETSKTAADINAPVDAWHNLGQATLLGYDRFGSVFETTANGTVASERPVMTINFNPVQSAWQVIVVEREKRAAVIAKEFDGSLEAVWQTYDSQGRVSDGERLTDDEVDGFRELMHEMLHSPVLQDQFTAMRERRDKTRERIDTLVDKAGFEPLIPAYALPKSEIMSAAKALHDAEFYAELKALEAGRHDVGIFNTAAVLEQSDPNRLLNASPQLF